MSWHELDKQFATQISKLNIYLNIAIQKFNSKRKKKNRNHNFSKGFRIFLRFDGKSFKMEINRNKSSAFIPADRLTDNPLILLLVPSIISGFVHAIRYALINYGFTGRDSGHIWDKNLADYQQVFPERRYANSSPFNNRIGDRPTSERRVFLKSKKSIEMEDNNE